MRTSLVPFELVRRCCREAPVEASVFQRHFATATTRRYTRVYVVASSMVGVMRMPFTWGEAHLSTNAGDCGDGRERERERNRAGRWHFGRKSVVPGSGVQSQMAFSNACTLKERRRIERPNS